MADSAPTANGGISFTGLLTIVFITLKLIGYISWSFFLLGFLLAIIYFLLKGE